MLGNHIYNSITCGDLTACQVKWKEHSRERESLWPDTMKELVKGVIDSLSYMIDRYM